MKMSRRGRAQGLSRIPMQLLICSHPDGDRHTQTARRTDDDVKLRRDVDQFERLTAAMMPTK